MLMFVVLVVIGCCLNCGVCVNVGVFWVVCLTCG